MSPFPTISPIMAIKERMDCDMSLGVENKADCLYYSHTPQAGAGNIDGGVTIDMQSINQVSISSDKSTVTIGAGNRWGNVFPTLDDQDVSMVGGRVNSVGVGGLTTGGE